VSSSGTDLQDLCTLLAEQLLKSDGFYLIMDGYDRIKYSKQCELQHNFRQLQSQGLRVLLFSAVSKLDVFPPAWPVECDKWRRKMACTSTGHAIYVLAISVTCAKLRVSTVMTANIKCLSLTMWST
jgi:hypothetical protein